MRLRVLALLTRSLRLEARAPRTYAWRAGLAVLMLLALVSAHAGGYRVSAAGLRLLSAITTLNFLFITLAGLTYFATAITEEKEAATLGLLRVAGLGRVAILLGKSTSRLTGAAILLLVQAPFTLLAVTLGGVSPTQVLAAYATLLAYLVLVAHLGLLASVWAGTSRAAIWLTGLLAGAFLLSGSVAAKGIALLGGWGAPGGPTGLAVLIHRGLALVVRANPYFRLREILSTGFAGPVVGTQVVSNVLVGLALFVLALVMFERAVRERGEPGPWRGRAPPRRPLLRWLGVGRPWSLPVAWQSFHFFCGGRALVVGRFVLLALLAAVLVAGSGVEAGGTELMLAAVGLAALEGAVHASRLLREEVDRGTLAGLMLTPMTPQELLRQKLCGLVPGLAPYGVCFLVGAALCPYALAMGVALLLTLPGLCVLCQYVAFAHFVVAMSLRHAHLGLVYAGVLWVAANVVVAFLAMLVLLPLGAAAALVVGLLMCVGCVLVAGECQRRIGRRLEELAGQ